MDAERLDKLVADCSRMEARVDALVASRDAQHPEGSYAEYIESLKHPYKPSAVREQRERESEARDLARKQEKNRTVASVESGSGFQAILHPARR